MLNFHFSAPYVTILLTIDLYVSNLFFVLICQFHSTISINPVNNVFWEILVPTIHIGPLTGWWSAHGYSMWAYVSSRLASLYCLRADLYSFRKFIEVSASPLIQRDLATPRPILSLNEMISCWLENTILISFISP